MAHKILEIYIEEGEMQKKSWDEKWFQTTDSIVINMSTLKSLLAMAKEKEEESESLRRESLHKNAKLEKYWQDLKNKDEFSDEDEFWTERFS